MQIRHDSQNSIYRQPFGAVTCGETVTLNIYAPGCAGASVRLWRNQSGETMVPMNRSAALFSAKIEMPKDPCILWYFFVLNYGSKVFCYGNNPESLGGEGCVYENSQPPSFQITVHNPFKIPSWYKNGLVYQIFPDRFARGTDFEERKAAALLPEGWQGASRFFEKDWHTLPYYIKDDAEAVTDWQFFGGTLNGIREKIPYLKSLGVSALYLNPIFRASSNHRYDTADYMQIDPLLGDNEIFQKLAGECRRHDIRIILDGVFSHSGADSIYFDKYGNYKNFVLKNPENPKELGAWLSEDSKYRSWYRFREEPPGYECWWGVTDLPNLEETDPSYDSYICGPGGVLENWMNLGASGFRLDVADELPDSFIKNIRAALKEKDSDNLLIGEVWEDASNKYSYGELRRYFAGDELDGTMNYPFRDSAIDYCIGKEGAEMFCKKMRSLQENYPAEAFYASLNIIGGHDCERILSVLGGYTPAKENLHDYDGRFIPKGAALDLNAEQYAQAKARLKMLSSLQYAMPGVPCIYYGDEAGVQGSKDPDNRRSYPWGREDQNLIYHYRMLGLIYRSHPVLKDGAFEIVDRDTCLFLIRGSEEETILTIVNPTLEKKFFSETFKTLFSSTYKNKKFAYGLELLKSEEITITETALETSVEPLSAQIILLKEEAPERLVLPKASGILCHLSSLPESDSLSSVLEADSLSVIPEVNSFSSLPEADGLSSMLEHNGKKKADNQIRFAGALGRRGRAFVDWLAESGFKLWQILPVNPVGAGNSPYFSPCVFAGETRYIDLDELPDDNGFDAFCSDNQYWLSDWAEYVIENNYMNYVSCHKNYSKDAMLYDIRYDQYVFFAQLKKLKEYANSKGILLIGDLPIYATPKSADLKAHSEYFQLDEDGRPLNTAGVPPDYFSETGQHWANPLYDWDAMEKDGYEWWYQRFRQAIKYFDYIRLDHFRSFSAYYAIPDGKLPTEGSWQQGPGTKFFYRIKERLGELPIIAEDLGLLDSDVFNMLKLSGFPGMNIWQFSAEEMKAMTEEEAQGRVFYSGTHDNQTLVGWCADSYPQDDPKEKAREIIEELMNSKAPWVIFQLQDILLLDDSARINTPATVEDNWLWHCAEPLPEMNMPR